MKGVRRYDHGLKSLSIWWEKIALIGKINSFEVASTILKDMDDTLAQFNHLQSRLVESLINEHTRKVLLQNISCCQMAIDVLIRNLFERTADIGFLSTDYDVVRFLKKAHINEEDRLSIAKHLHAYVSIYSVYQDVILLKPDGELVFQLNQPTRSGQIRDSFIQQAVRLPNQYVEYFGATQLMEKSQVNLLYANAVVENDAVIGVLVLCFRFRNELEGIMGRLSSARQENPLLLINGAGEVLFAPKMYHQQYSSTLSLKTALQMITVNGKSVVAVCAKGQAYQGYAGPENWRVTALLAVENLDSEPSHFVSNKSEGASLFSDFTGLISADLYDIRQCSISINDDLQLIVLNGIITAAREKAIEFMPVLEAIKKIGRDIDKIFADSIDSLFSTIISGQLDAIKLQASLAVDIMDRNLYERANDCRWWGLSSLLRSALSASPIDKVGLQQTLAKIHRLYTVYHTLYVYDKQACYVAFSDARYQEKVGHRVEQGSGAQAVFGLKNSYQYCVSSFSVFDCYNGESTYIYNAALRDLKEEEVIGGIGIVFDSTTEFKAILNDILPREQGEVKEGVKALFTSDKGVVIACSSPDHVVGEVFWPDIDSTQLNKEGTTATVLRLGGVMYLIGAARSNGYREYKCQDGYKNPIIAWVLVPC
ncbi:MULTISPECIES: hypothetical protein [Marinomonas]|uniref:Cache domain-containing protein n=1 Tax=Marinomonas arctica TaxID=383750 RepID=A0A7H1J920_9GAMM|nr:MULTISPECIES: hypothetical protein [Marinomonas]QNT06986.1 cache domain-containing protein [Marinomonas arctica]